MKKISYLLVILFIFNFCKKNSTEPTSEESITDKIIGTWNLESVVMTDQSSSLTLRPPNVTGTLTFTKSDFTLTISIPSENWSDSASGFYSVSGNTISFNNGNLYGILENNNICITVTDENTKIEYNFKK